MSITAVLAITAVASGAARSHRNGMPATHDVHPATVTAGGCTVPKANYVGTDAAASTSSTTYVTVPSMTRTFKIAGTTKTCVLVTFSAMGWAPAGELVDIEAVLDGTKVASPGEVQLTGDTDENSDGKWARSHAMQSVFSNVSPGSHTVVVLYRSFFGGSVTLNKSSMIVLHK